MSQYTDPRLDGKIDTAQQPTPMPTAQEPSDVERHLAELSAEVARLDAVLCASAELGTPAPLSERNRDHAAETLVNLRTVKLTTELATLRARCEAAEQERDGLALAFSTCADMDIRWQTPNGIAQRVAIMRSVWSIVKAAERHQDCVYGGEELRAALSAYRKLAETKGEP